MDVGGGAGEREVAARAGRSVTENQLFEALCQNFGVLACAAIHLGLTLASLVQRVARSKRLRTWRDAARSVLIGHANELLQVAVAAGEPWALQFCARAGVKTGVPADTGKPVELISFSAHRVAQPVGQGEPRPDLAEAMSRRMVVALERGEPWAVMYCLSHLDPTGPFFAKCRRGWQHDLWTEQLAAAPMVTVSAAKVGDCEIVDSKNVLEGSGDVEPRMMVDADEGLDGLAAAPPVCGELDQPSTTSSAPPVTGTITLTPTSEAAPPISPRGVALSPQPDCRDLFAASAPADATRLACTAPPVCGGARRSVASRSERPRARSDDAPASSPDGHHGFPSVVSCGEKIDFTPIMLAARRKPSGEPLRQTGCSICQSAWREGSGLQSRGQLASPTSSSLGHHKVAESLRDSNPSGVTGRL